VEWNSIPAGGEILRHRGGIPGSLGESLQLDAEEVGAPKSNLSQRRRERSEQQQGFFSVAVRKVEIRFYSTTAGWYKFGRTASPMATKLPSRDNALT